MDENKNTGGVFANWHDKVLKSYMDILRIEIEKLKTLPASEWLITEGDVDDLLELAAIFGVEISEEDIDELYNLRVYKYYLGLIKKRAKDMILEDLRPGNPLEQDLKEAEKQWKDLDFEED